MKKWVVVVMLVAAVMMIAVPASAQKGKAKACVAIQDGTLTYAAGHFLSGHPLMTGYDPYGYNYQAHMFKGSYFNAYSGGAGLPPYEGDDSSYLAANPGAAFHWAWPYRADELIMKWNDAWISNRDCDGDGKLDRHFGFPSYIGSGAWETNHQTYVGTDGSSYQYFVKIVAVPESATKVDGIWYTKSGKEIGPDIWGEFAIIQEVTNDPDYSNYRSPAGPGFGKWR